MDAEARAEIEAVERQVGPRGLRPWPWHFWCRKQIEDGTASPELVEAARRSREYYAQEAPEVTEGSEPTPTREVVNDRRTRRQDHAVYLDRR